MSASCITKYCQKYNISLYNYFIDSKIDISEYEKIIKTDPDLQANLKLNKKVKTKELLQRKLKVNNTKI